MRPDILSVSFNRSILNNRRALALAAIATIAVASQSNAATYTYTTSTTAAENWSTSGWSATPVSAADTTLVFGSVTPSPVVALAASTVISTTNDVANPFQLNLLTARYQGPTPVATAPTVTISGSQLQFSNNAALTPVLSLEARSNSGGTAPAKVVLTLSNSILLDSNKLTIVGAGNNAGGAATGNVFVNGAITYANAQAHTIELTGDVSATASTGTAGRNVLGAALGNQSVSNATSVTKTGTSFWELASANTYSGGTTVTGGTLMFSNLSGLGSGSVSASGGGTVFLNATGTWTKDFSISGNGAGNFGALRLSPDAVLSGAHTVTLTGDSRIGANSDRTKTATIASKITGTGNLTLGTTSANGLTLVVSNPANDYVGNTTLQGEQSTTTSGSSTSAQDFLLGASNVFAPGNLTLSMGTRSTLTLQMRGNNETINGLNFAGAALLGRTITNGLAASASVLSVGDNDANGSFRGSITGSSTSTVGVTKIGAGTQTLNGSTTYYGNTTVTSGKLTLDYNLYTNAQTNSPTNYFSQNSALVLNGGTLAIGGRDAGNSGALSGTLSGRVFTVADTTGFVAGQSIQEVTSGAVAIYIAGVDRTANALYLSEVPVFATPSTINVNAMSAGTTSQTLKSLQLAASSTLDFGTTGGVFLTFASAPTQTLDGSILSIANWSGIVDVGGGTDRLLFAGAPTDFSSIFSQAEVNFIGQQPGYQLIDLGGSYEVVPGAIPEPASLSVLALGGLGLLSRRLRRR